MQYTEAQKILNLLKLPRYLKPVGSLRRKSQIVNDFDFITIKKLSSIKKDLLKRYNDVKFAKSGKLYMQAIINNFPIDIWKTTKEELPFALFGRTGPQIYMVITRRIAKLRGMKLTNKGLFNLETGEPIKGIKTERDIPKVLNIRYVPPTQRDKYKKKAYPLKSKIQSVIFKKNYWSPEQAIQWLKKNKLKFNKIDENRQSYRFRQFPPSKSKRHITEKKEGYISFVKEY